ncbi:MAG: cation diffusion facilitator family transporter [Clostridia bacterium]|nr:cation diffusion facilitator family transporter [Clostridia bacterium]
MTDFLLKIFVKDYKNTADKKVRENYGTLGSFVGILCNILLCAIKITAGLLAKSMSIIADGLNNLSDMGSSVITMIGFKLSNKPADRDHPFGHGRMEYMSAFIVSVLILIVGFELGSSSVKALIYGEEAPRYTVLSLVILAVSAIIKLWMYIFNKKLGKTISSDALLATAQDSINDAITTSAILVSTLVSFFVKNLPFNLDAVMALFVALFILWSGINSAKETLASLLGKAPDKQLIEDIEKTVMTFDGFLGIHDMIVHDYGPGRQFASLHIEVPQNVDIVECHEKIDLCEKVVFEKTGVELVIHMDPIDIDNEEVNSTKQSIAEAVKEIDERLTIHDFRMTPTAHQRTNLIFDVVLPADSRMTDEELISAIGEKAKKINKTFVCVITIDRDFTGIM